jgi:putative ABC transport system substrate-binding protein
LGTTDPVNNGFVATLSRPGGNTTGLASSLEDTSTKQIELLATSVPTLSRVGLLMNPSTPTASAVLRSAQASARKADLVTVVMEARSSEEIENAVSTLSNERVGAVMVIPDAFFFSERHRIAERMVERRLPTVFAQREYVEAGGLMSYGENLKDFFRRAASFVDKIFKGAKAGELPIEQPTRFYLVVNLKTAKALGLTIPESFLLRADEVIE